MMTLTKKRVATIEALSQRFGNPANITRAQIQIAIAEKIITAWPYWLTDDLTLKVGRGVHRLPTPDEFTIAGKGEKATKPSTKRALVARGEAVPSFTKPKVEKPATVETKPLKVKKTKNTEEPMVDVVAPPKKTRKAKTTAPVVEEQAATQATA